MNCRDWEERIALYTGGDLPPAESAEVERHLRDCAGCQLFASGFEQSLALLREAHDEPLAPAHFATVRARVLAKLERRPLWARRWAYGLVAAGAVLIAILVLWPARVPLPPAIVATRPPAPEWPQAAAAAAPPKIARTRRHERAVASVEQATHPVTPAAQEPLVVKLLTDDPDVVIYWITDSRGELK